MEQIILDMTKEAERTENYELIQYVKRLVDTLAMTSNAPSNWREIAAELAKKYEPHTWVHEELELWNYES